MNIRVLLVAVMALLSVQSHAQLEASVLEDCYGEIRADIVRDACKIVGFDKSDVMDSITESCTTLVKIFPEQMSRIMIQRLRRSENLLKSSCS